MSTDNRTEHLNLPLPHVDNDLDFDVERLRAALNGLDASLGPLIDQFAGLAAAVPAGLIDTVSGLQASIGTLTTGIGTANTTIGTHTTQIAALQNARGAASGLAELDANGLLPVARVPSLAATAIGSGTFDVARIPDLAAAKIVSGTLNASRIPTLDAAKVGSGTFNEARIPALPTSRITNLDTALAGKFSTGGGSIGGNVAVTGDITATGDITSTSDARLKTRVVTIDGALEKVCSLRGVYYEKDGARRLGVIAQEVRDVVPEVVVEGTDHLSVAYGNLVGLLIEAVKEIEARL